MKRHTSHIFFYILEVILILGTFLVILILGLSLWEEVALLGGMLLSYIVLGILHHRSHHDIKGRVVLEYLLVSILVLSMYLFLNITRI